MNRTKLIGDITALLTITVILGAIFWLIFGFHTVPEGHRGVHTKWGAAIDNQEVMPGAKIVTPIEQGVYNVNIRYQSMDVNGLSIKTEDGVNLDAQANLVYRVKPSQAVEVYSNYGKDYQSSLALRQKFRDALKNVGDRYNEEIYKGKRSEYVADVESRLGEKLNGTGIEIQSVQLTNINLPDSIEVEINNKIAKKHERQAAERQVDIAKQKARAKVEEAKGTREAMKIIQEKLEGKTGERWVTLQFIREGMEKGDMVYMMGNPSQPFSFTEDLPKATAE